MPGGSILSKLFRKNKKQGKEGDDTVQQQPHHHHHHHNITHTGYDDKDKNDKNIIASSLLTPKASSMSKTDSVDSISLRKLRLSRFLEKKWANGNNHHHSKKEDGSFGTHKQTTDHSPYKFSEKGKHSAEQISERRVSKFDDFNALEKLVKKYGVIPSKESDALEIYLHEHPIEVKLATSEDDALIVGKGAGGSVLPIFDSADQKVYALKKIRQPLPNEKWDSYNKKLRDEYKLAHSMNHQNVVVTYDLLHDSDLFVIVMDYVPYDFFTIIMSGKFGLEEAYCYFKQMINGVAYLHGRGIAHRDLKLDNCVVDKNGVLKLVDFGSSVVWERNWFESGKIHTYKEEIGSIEVTRATGILGSDPYLSPEVFYQQYYDPSKADIWSLAIIFYCMIKHQFPWRIPKPKEDKIYNMFTMNDKEIVDKNGKKKIVGKQRVINKLPADSRELLNSMFELIPDRRLTVFDIQNNSFFQGIEACHYSDDSKFISGNNHTHYLITRQEFDSAEALNDNANSKGKEKKPLENNDKDLNVVVAERISNGQGTDPSIRIGTVTLPQGNADSIIAENPIVVTNNEPAMVVPSIEVSTSN